MYVKQHPSTRYTRIEGRMITCRTCVKEYIDRIRNDLAFTSICNVHYKIDLRKSEYSIYTFFHLSLNSMKFYILFSIIILEKIRKLHSNVKARKVRHGIQIPAFNLIFQENDYFIKSNELCLSFLSFRLLRFEWKESLETSVTTCNLRADTFLNL